MVFKLKATLKDQSGARQILQIDDAADCAGSLDPTCVKCAIRVSVAEHLHNLSPHSLYSVTEVSAEAWHGIPYLVTPWHYLPRLGVLFCILSRLGSLRQGSAALECYPICYHASEAWLAIPYLITPGQYRQRLGCYSIYYHALAVSAKALQPWHAISYHALQYPPRLGLLFHILSRLGSISLGLAFYSMLSHALAVSAEAWHAILYIIMPWQYPPRPICYHAFKLGSIRRKSKLQKPEL